MTQSLTQEQSAQLQECFLLAQDPKQQADASKMFAQLSDSLSSNPIATELLAALWNEVLAARRSAAFWQQFRDVEKEMSDKLAKSHLQLRQNYLRLMQEQ
ncbi:hypothetical protein [Leptothermofonsia sp. ETS-13]|uniref:hypothetical protein n=1 Tax=Leptothermofonsia sp. ETS-13 TaxID=3035696 RepID=UPI003BA2904C